MSVIIVVLALGAALFFGLALVLTQLGLRHLDPLRGSCVSIPTATALFVALSPFTIDFSQWDTRSAIIFALIGCSYPALVTILTFHANRRIGPNLTGALGNLAPLFAVVIAIMVLGEAPGAAQIAAVLIIVAGVALLYRTLRLNPVAGIAWAFALPVAAAAIRGAVQATVKIGLEGWPNPFAAVTIGYLVSTFIVLTSGAMRERGWPLTYSRNGWLCFAGVGVCNGLGVLSLYQALALGPVTVVAALAATYPLATLIFGRIFLGPANITRQTVIGVGVTVAGVALLLGA